jgi:transcriptional regulator with XRE-family HTH domain
MDSVGENIKRRRKLLGITQNALSRLSGISQSAISDIENPQVTKLPNIDTIKKLAAALQCTVSDLTGETVQDNAAVLSPIERRLLAAVARLNAQGMEKVIAYAEDLCETEKYIRGAAASAV